MPNNQSKFPSTNRTAIIGFVCLCLLPAVMIAFAPSYQTDVIGREVAVGSDFFQEWIGATIISRGEMDRLYDWQYSRDLQHDPALVGFAWDESQYYPMVYPPFHYWLLQPLSWISCLAAARLWCVLNGLAIAVAGWLLFREFKTISKSAKFIPLVMLGFSPILLSLNMGQKSGFLLLIYTLCFILLRSHRPYAAGVAFGLVLFKPQLAIVILLILLVRRDWRFLLGFASTGSFFASVTLLHGLQPFWEFLSIMRGAGTYMESAGYKIQDAHNLWCVIRNSLAFLPPIYAGAVFAMFASVLLFGITRSTLSQQRKDTRDETRLLDEFSLGVLATLLLSPHLLTYDLSLLALPMSIELVRRSSAQGLPHSGLASWSPIVAAILFLGSWWSVPLAELMHVQLTTLLMMAWCLSLSCRSLGHSAFASFRRNPSASFLEPNQSVASAKIAL